MERLMTTTALGLALAVTPALADDMPHPKTADTESMRYESMNKSQVRTPRDATAGERDVEFIRWKTGSHRLATELIGQPVYGPANERIGDANDLVTSRDGRIDAAVIGVGGFLEVGEKDVAVSFGSLTFQNTADNALKLTLNASREKLESAPAFRTTERSADSDAGSMKTTAEGGKTSDEQTVSIIDKIKKAFE
jgi:hypothetical protein